MDLVREGEHNPSHTGVLSVHIYVPTSAFKVVVGIRPHIYTCQPNNQYYYTEFTGHLFKKV